MNTGLPHGRVPFRQQGATLIIALIFLVLMSLFAINAFMGSSTNLRVVGNMQVRQEAISAAQDALEATISNANFAKAPADTASAPVTVDIDGNGSTDYVVRLNPQPTCYRVMPIKNNQLDPNVAADRECIVSSLIRNSGIDTSEATVSSDDSLCANTEWNLRAQVTDIRTGALVAVNQGVGIRVLSSDAATSCN